MRALLALLIAAPAFAQSGLPHPDPSHPGAASHIVTKNGACVWWYVYLPEFTPQNQLGIEFVAYCTAVSEFPKIGGRLQTIVNSAEPLKSLQTLRNRIAMSRITCPGMGACTAEDPALAPVVAEMNAARGK